MALMAKRYDLDINGVSYRGSGMALTDVVGGHVPMMFIPLPEALPQAAAGNVRILAIADDKRDRRVPTCPPSMRPATPVCAV